MSEVDVIWADPPEPEHFPRSRAKSRERRALAAALKAHPGRWALIEEFPPLRKPSAWSLLYVIRRAEVACWGPAGSYEAVLRLVDDYPTIYARYVKKDS